MSIKPNHNESFTHWAEFGLYDYMFMQAQYAVTECAFLDMIINLLGSKISTIIKHYLPAPLKILDKMKARHKKLKAMYDKWCRGSGTTGMRRTTVSARAIYNDDGSTTIVRQVLPYHKLLVSATGYCRGKLPEQVGTRAKGWRLPSRWVAGGSTVTLSPPAEHQGGRLDGSVVVDGKTVPLVNGKATITVTRLTRVVFKYRCKKDLARAQATERAALQEQARQVDQDLGVLAAQWLALVDLDLKCFDECEKIRGQIAGLKAQRDAAAVALGALQAEEAQAKGKVAKTEGEIADLNIALAVWNAKTPEQQYADHRQAAQDHIQAGKDVNTERRAAAQERSAAMRGTYAAMATARGQGPLAFAQQYPAIRQSQREIAARHTQRLKVADKRLKDAQGVLDQSDLE
ncbi:hypothetical protein IIA16_02065, partial [bacterium]|nr:hypothetical protein [bacterium]